MGINDPHPNDSDAAAAAAAGVGDPDRDPLAAFDDASPPDTPPAGLGVPGASTVSDPPSIDDGPPPPPEDEQPAVEGGAQVEQPPAPAAVAEPPADPPTGGQDPPPGDDEPTKTTKDRPYYVLQEIELTETLLANLQSELAQGGRARKALFYIETELPSRNGDHALRQVWDRDGEKLGPKPRLLALTVNQFKLRSPEPPPPKQPKGVVFR
jgi:hypothetical protein